MKLQPFNLGQWLHLGKPDCVRTREGNKVIELKYHDNVSTEYQCLSGIIQRCGIGILAIWYMDGTYSIDSKYKIAGFFHPYDLMLRLEDKVKTFGKKK